jgi:hypothetical protein
MTGARLAAAAVVLHEFLHAFEKLSNQWALGLVAEINLSSL